MQLICKANLCTESNTTDVTEWGKDIDGVEKDLVIRREIINFSTCITCEHFKVIK